MAARRRLREVARAVAGGEPQQEVGGEPPGLELLSAWFCPFAQRAWIALEEKTGGSRYERYTLTESQQIAEDRISYVKIPKLLAANPNGLVPTLVDSRRQDEGKEATVVFESLICLEYIDECCGDPTVQLFPGAAPQRARQRMAINFVEKKVVAPFYRLLMKRGSDDRTTAANDLKAAIRQFTAGMAPGKEGPFYEGQNFTAIDIAAAPWLAARLFVLNKFRGFLVPQTVEFDRFHQWRDAVLRRPSVKATLADSEALLESYVRYADGTVKSQVGDAVRNGTAMP